MLTQCFYRGKKSKLLYFEALRYFLAIMAHWIAGRESDISSKDVSAWLQTCIKIFSNTAPHQEKLEISWKC